MKRSLKETLIRLLIMLVGLTIAHLGVTLFILADLGSDPFNVFVQGCYRSLNKLAALPWLTHGRVHIVICFAIILILLVVDRSYVKIGTILCMFAGGPIIDFFSLLLSGLFGNTSPFLIRLLGLACGCVILAFGMTIVMKSDSGVGPNDLVAIIISDKTHRSFSVVRIIVDGCFILIGFLFGGTFGIGTIICAGIVGPVAGVFLPHSERLVSNAVKKLM